MTTRFIKIRCESCKNEQVIFIKPSTEVKCLVCEKTLSQPTGGKGKIKNSQLLEVL